MAAAASSSSRTIIIGGNWKCNGTRETASKLVDMLKGVDVPKNAQVVVAPTALQTSYVVENLSAKERTHVAVQNMSHNPKAGAWTGELTPDLVKDAGCNWCILGHSERRANQKESPELVGDKTKTALEAGLHVIACVGEQLEDRDASRTMDVVVEQLDPIVKACQSANAWDQLVIAYEPVWAIGTGRVATPEQAQEVHADIRSWLKGKTSESIAQSTSIIYGGSVKADNCNDLIVKPDVDGFLVGGASLKQDFVDIIKSASLKARM